MPGIFGNKLSNASLTDDNSIVTAPGGTTVDAFGRTRVSNPETIFDSKQIFDNQPLFWDDQEVSGTGTTSVYSQDQARTRIGVANTTAGKRVRQTFMRFNYQPGKSQLILMTSVISNAGAGINACVGIFDDNNGLFFEANNSVLNVVRRTSTSGSPVDNKVAQSDWNVDKLDGSGISGITLDPTKTQIIWFDMEWLGVGRARAGFVIAGAFITVHEFLNANVLDVVYMSTPNLPLRYSIENDGTGAATTMDHICSTVISEGGNQDLATGSTANPSTNTVTAGTLIDSGYAEGNSLEGTVLANAILLGSAIDDTLDTMVLAVTPLSTNLDISGVSLTWREIS